MQLPKPILLEGSPGVGKTSLVSALAKAAGHNLVRINLSEQTDMMDLLGADLPADGAPPASFGGRMARFWRRSKTEIGCCSTSSTSRRSPSWKA